MKISTLNTVPKGFPVILIRPGIIVRLAHLGRLDGDDHALIGTATDFTFTEATIVWGIASAPDIAGIELTLAAPLFAVMDEGRTVRVTSYTRPTPQRIIAIEPMPPEPEAGKTYAYDSLRASIAANVYAAAARSAQQREDALKLRLPVWDVASMKHRGDFPAWLPEFAREILRESSRVWLELQNAPKGFVVAKMPPALPGTFGSTKHPTLPQTAGGLR